MPKYKRYAGEDKRTASARIAANRKSDKKSGGKGPNWSHNPGKDY